MSKARQKPKLDSTATQTMEMQVKKEEKRSKYFFIRRVPFRRVEREWTRPPDSEYQKKLLEQGFLTPDLVEGRITKELGDDIRELEQHLLPHFWRMNQEAKYFQNRYYQYQWIFILAAFFTTAFAAVNVLTYAWDGDQTHILGTIRWTELLGFMTAVISGLAAMVSFLDANQTPQDRWFKARAKAESLRSMYFLFMARQNPFNLPQARDRIYELRRKVIDVLTASPGMEQRPSVSATGRFPVSAPPGSQEKADNSDSEKPAKPANPPAESDES